MTRFHIVIAITDKYLKRNSMSIFSPIYHQRETAVIKWCHRNYRELIKYRIHHESIDQSMPFFSVIILYYSLFLFISLVVFSFLLLSFACSVTHSFHFSFALSFFVFSFRFSFCFSFPIENIGAKRCY